MMAEPRSDRGVDQGILEVCCCGERKRVVGIDVGLCPCGRISVAGVGEVMLRHPDASRRGPCVDLL